jgi:hypothetical protein
MEAADRSAPTPSPAAQRRDVLRAGGAAALGIGVSALPTAARAASPGSVESTSQLAATTVTALPAGYGNAGSGSTGAITVSWTAVAGAASYTLYARTGEDAFSPASTSLTGTSTQVSSLAAGVPYDLFVVATATDPGTSSSQSSTVSALSSIATGGSIATYTQDSATFVVHVFDHDAGDETDGQTSHSFSVHRAIDVDHLIVAGGGGGGGDVGGGGGAGGLVTTLTTASGAGSGAVGRAVGAHAVLVGRGGTGGASSASADGRGGDGRPSVFAGVTTVGGGGGGTWGGGTAGTAPGSAGGSGGGAAGIPSGSPQPSGGAGTAGQGSAGGAGLASDPPFSGGGGGGALEAGTAGANDTTPSGGAGLAVAIMPPALATTLVVGEVAADAVHFAGGGGAGSSFGAGPGGLGGGGLGATRGGVNSVGGAPRTGGGGGGHGGVPSGTATVFGAPGGSGVVILRYALPSLG